MINNFNIFKMKIKRTLSLLTVLQLVTVIFLFDAYAQQGRPANPAPARQNFRMPPRIISPEILPDNRVIFRVLAKDAGKISVSGEWQAGFGASEQLVKNEPDCFR
jgi:hypothetical protein